MEEPVVIYWIDPTGTEWRSPGYPDIPTEEDPPPGVGFGLGPFGTMPFGGS